MRLYETASARYPESERHRCRSCGFLAKKRDLWHEVTDEERDLGDLHGSTGRSYEQEINLRPACFRHAFGLGQEWKDAVAAAEADIRWPALPAVFRAGRTILDRDRECQKWCPYTPGFSPKDHFEELRMMQLEEDRRKHNVELAQLRAASDERGLALGRTLADITTKLHDVASRTERFTTTWTYFALGIAITALLIAAVGVGYTVASYYHAGTATTTQTVTPLIHPAVTPPVTPTPKP
jgi:F0F1-type ATP synthase membrane subunit c/vacuolar-type H+-ATPase subunit K